MYCSAVQRRRSPSPLSNNDSHAIGRSGLRAPLMLSRLAGPLRRVVRPLGRAKLVSHRLVGRLVELAGNQVTIEALHFSVDNPLITTRQKGLLDVGLHETGEIALACRYIVADLPVVELGGGIGVVSCIINRRLSRPTDHVVVDANADLIPTLEANRRLNGAGFRIRNVALAYGSVETRSEEHTSELQSQFHLVCRLLL